MQSPRLYATFLLWLLSELFEELPEVGDLDKPKLVFFFDEAHLLFNDAPKALIDKVEQVVRLIRSKGVGVYFITQNPLDVPEMVLAQLGNRVQHALRAFTPREQKAVSAAAETFRPNPAFNTAEAITELGVGEALVSTLEAKGVPAMVERTLIAPPMAHGPDRPWRERQQIVACEPLQGQVRPDGRSGIRLRDAGASAPNRRRTRRRPRRGRRHPRHARRPLRNHRPAQGLDDDHPAGDAEVTRTIVNQTVGQSRGRDRQVHRRPQGSSIGRAIVRGTLGGLLRR